MLGLYVGYQSVCGNFNDFSYIDWKIGLFKIFDEVVGIILGLVYVGIDLKDGVIIILVLDGVKNVGKNGFVFFISKIF